MRCHKALSPAIAIALAAGLLTAAPGAHAENITLAAVDTAAPTLGWVKLTSKASITPDGVITFDWSVDDQGDGVDRVNFDVTDTVDASVGSTTKVTGTQAISGGVRTTGTTTLTPNRTNMKPGKLIVKSIQLVDKAGNTTTVTNASILAALSVAVSNPDYDSDRPVVTGTWSKSTYAPGERAVLNWKLTDAHPKPGERWEPQMRLSHGVFLRNVVTGSTATTISGYSYWDIPEDYEYGSPLSIGSMNLWDQFSNWQNVQDNWMPIAKVDDPAHPVDAITYTGTPGAGQKLTVDTSTWKGATVKVTWNAGVNSMMSTVTGNTFTFPAFGKGYTPNTPFTIKVTGTWPDKTVRTRQLTGISDPYNVPAAAPGKVGFTGTAQVGNKLTGTATGWPAGYNLMGQWKFSDDTPAAPVGATSINLTSEHSGKKLKYCITATKAGAQATGTCETKEIARGDFGNPTSTIHWAKGYKTRAVVGDTAAITFVEPRVPGLEVRYQWRIDGKDVPGANKKTFTIPASATGKLVHGYVVLTAPGYSYKSVWAPGSTAKQPTVGDAVIVSGTNKVGSTLTAKPGYWTKGTKLSHQWQRNGKTIRWGSTYKLTADDVGKYITVKTTAYRDGGETIEMTSPSIGKTGYGTYDKTNFTISGYTKNHGSTLWANQKTGWMSKQKLSYQWYRNGKAIKGATSSKYKTTKSDRRTDITLKVTRTVPGYAGKQVVSTNKLIVAPSSLKSISAKVKGDAKYGKTLSLSRSSSTSGTKYHYQWYKNGKAIKGATSRNYKIAKGDVGSTLQLRINMSKPGYYDRTAWTNKVKASAYSLKSIKAKATGTAKAGKTLSLSRTSSTSGTKYYYQWYKNGKPIKKATSRNYKISSSDKRATLQLRIKMTKYGYYDRTAWTNKVKVAK